MNTNLNEYKFKWIQVNIHPPKKQTKQSQVANLNKKLNCAKTKKWHI